MKHIITLPKESHNINIEDKNAQGLSLSPDGRCISYRLFKAATGSKTTIAPGYVTGTGFTTDMPACTKVGLVQASAGFINYLKRF